MRPQASTRRSLGRSIFATALVVGLLAAVPGSPSAGAQTAEGGAWTIDTVAGTGVAGFSGDGGPATSAQVERNVPGAVPDNRGNVYVVDLNNNRLRMIDPSGIITTIAGTGVRGFSGDGGPATSARTITLDVAVDDEGNLYLADLFRVRKIDTNGIITTIAGTGVRGFSGDGGPAISARLGAHRIALDDDRNLYIADQGGHRIRKIDTDGIITTVAGTGTRGFSGDGGPATSAQLNGPQDIDIDQSGNLYIADYSNRRVRKVDPNGIITTFAGNGQQRHGGDGGPATSAQIYSPSGVAVQGTGNVFISEDAGHAIRRVDAAGTIETVAGTLPFAGFYGDGGFGPDAALNDPKGVHINDNGDLYFSDSGNYRIRHLETSYLWINSAGGAPGRVGDSLTYILNVSGLPTTATGVNVTSTLGADFAFEAAAPSQGSCAENAGTVTCELGTVETGTVATVELTVTPLRAGVIPFSATVSSDPEVIPGNRTATASTRVSAAGCGRTVTTDTVLTEDLGPCAGNGVLFGADGVTFDLGGNRIFGFDNPGDGHEAGLRVHDRTGVTVTNGTVTGFDAGVVVEGGGSNTVSGMTITDNVGPESGFTELGDGVAIVESPGNFVVNNVITNNGIYDGVGVLGVGSDNNTVEGNTIEGTLGPASRGLPFGQGVIVNAAAFGELTAEVVSGTRINHNVIRDNASAGIANINNVHGEIVRNTIENNGHRQTFGNGIGVQLGLGLADDDSNLVIQGNQVHGNALDGIQVNADQNRLLANNATNNGGFDLFDKHPDCANNVWRNNTWGSGGYSPDCVTLGGKGPRTSGKGKSATTSSPEVTELQRGRPADSGTQGNSDPLGTP